MPFQPEEVEALRQARADLEAAYELFNWATDERLIDEAIHRIRVAELRLDNLTHQGEKHAGFLPWVHPGEGIS